MTKELKMTCFNGMTYTVKDDAQHLDLRDIARKRESQGYDVTWLDPNQIEVNGDGLVDDRMGWVKLVTIKEPTHTCWECGFEVPEGEVCTCFEEL